MSIEYVSRSLKQRRERRLNVERRLSGERRNLIRFECYGSDRRLNLRRQLEKTITLG